jgi:hypothetical protein
MRHILSGWQARSVVLPLLFALSLTGCVRHGAEAPAASPPPASPTGVGAAFAKILAVEDNRKFEERPRDPSAPTLNDTADFGNQDRMARAVGRQRDPDGAAGANIFLPANETVARLVRAATEKALRDKGYTLVGEGSPHYGAASSLSVQITQFWIWQTPGELAKSAEFRAAVVVTGDALLEPSTSIESYAAEDSADVDASQWRQIMEAGIGDLGKRLGERLKSPTGS